MAKAAELNGVPGPAHMLEMKKENHLTEAQIEKIREIFDEMKNQAIQLGTQLVKQARELDQYFLNGIFFGGNPQNTPYRDRKNKNQSSLRSFILTLQDRQAFNRASTGSIQCPTRIFQIG